MNDIKERRKKRREYSEINNRLEVKDIDGIEIITDGNDSSYNIKRKKISERKLTRGEKLFLLANIIIILGLIGYYGYRAIYYYKREHQVEDKITLKEKITNIENITYKDDGLYEKNDYFFYKGKNVDNYVYYSGRMFRIISIKDDIKMIEDDIVTNLVYGLDKYDKSVIHEWLGNYLDTYKDYDIYLKESNWCNSSVDISNYNCNEYLNEYVGLISTKEYLDAGGQDSYLNNNSYFWTINYHDDTPYFINNAGSINNYVKDNINNYFSYGIRPVITISGNLLYLSGDGTRGNPYTIEEDTPSLIKNSSVGDYCNYNDMQFRVVNVDDTGVSLMLENDLEIEKSYDDAIKYLNNEFLAKFNKDDLVKQDMIVNLYNYENKYNYREEVKRSSNYIIIPKVGDLFINIKSNYWLSTLGDKKVEAYYFIDNNAFYGDIKKNSHGVKPIIKVKGDLIIKDGNGTSIAPLVLGDL